MSDATLTRRRFLTLVFQVTGSRAGGVEMHGVDDRLMARGSG